MILWEALIGGLPYHQYLSSGQLQPKRPIREIFDAIETNSRTFPERIVRVFYYIINNLSLKQNKI